MFNGKEYTALAALFFTFSILKVFENPDGTQGRKPPLTADVLTVVFLGSMAQRYATLNFAHLTVVS